MSLKYRLSLSVYLRGPMRFVNSIKKESLRITRTIPLRTSSVEEEEMGGKTELEILVKSLSVCFNKQHKDLFQVNL